MLDADLAALYGVATANLNKAVSRNRDRFPGDFMFQLTRDEYATLRFHSGTSKRKGRGGRRYMPYVFTAPGVAMLSSVLRSRRAILVNVEIIRAFVRLRRILANHADLGRRVDALEEKYDKSFALVFEAIRQLMEPEDPPSKGRIGFGSACSADV